MLTQIQCDKFAEEFRTVDFHPGLNTVLGSIGGSNALGKSTFLWIIDYMYGGEGYCLPSSDIKQNVKDHSIRATFLFDGKYHYFVRNTATPKSVSRCDKAGHLIQNMSLEEYRKFLAENYHPGVPFDDMTARFFRIYGKENTYEKYPYLAKPKEADEKAVDFLLRLFGKGAVIAALRAAEDELGIKEAQWVKSKLKPKSFEKIEENEVLIASLRSRLQTLMRQEGDTGMALLGLDTGSFEAVSKLQKDLRSLTRRRNQLKSRLEAVRNGNVPFINTPIADDFEELKEFFPSVNIRELSQVEAFHRQLQTILQQEIADEVATLEPLIARCDAEIARLTQKLETSGVTADVTQRILSQCVSISKQIDKLEEENRELRHEKEMQEQRVLAERQFEQLISQRDTAIIEVVTLINQKLAELNAVVTGGKETAPTIEISPQKEISFITKGNTSEGTAYKSMVLYDLALLSLTGVSALIHDGNILQSISRDNFKEILQLYRSSGKQVFIAVDKEEVENLTDSVVLELSENHLLFGRSWSKNNA